MSVDEVIEGTRGQPATVESLTADHRTWLEKRSEKERDNAHDAHQIFSAWVL